MRFAASNRYFYFATALVIVCAMPSIARGAEDEGFHPNNWNGKRIYLSPADHNNPGCGNYREGENMHRVAHSAGVWTNDGAGSLFDRGYKVRIGHGTYTQAVARSNGWNSNRHIPMHSNARSGAECGYNSGGTQAFYCCGSANGEELARKLKQKVGDSSPGTLHERVDQRPGLYELNSTSAPAAYLEAEFHDWSEGKNWLEEPHIWSWRIAYAVDLALGYP